jgi:AmmeMemoRadiSam system protein A
MRFTASEKRTLILLAARAIADKMAPGLISSTRIPELTDTLQRKCGAFVSIYMENELKGCIGTFSESEPLFINVENMAISAALEDHRFSTIKSHELPLADLEISILTPRLKISTPSEIILGRHGIYIQSGHRRGTFLPQVAVHQNWTVEEFLGNCCKYKVGIGWEDWKSSSVFIYETYVIKAPFPPL